MSLEQNRAFYEGIKVGPRDLDHRAWGHCSSARFGVLSLKLSLGLFVSLNPKRNALQVQRR